MTKEEIGQVKIVKAIYVNNNWKVSVELNGDNYSMKLKGISTIKDIDLSGLIYDKLLEMDIIIISTSSVIISKPTLVDTTPKEKLK